MQPDIERGSLPPLPKSTHQRVHHNSKMAVIRSRAAFAERCPPPPPPKELSTTISPTQKQPRSEVDRGHPCPRLYARTCDALVAHYASLPTSKLSAHLAENNGDRWSGIPLPETSFPSIDTHFNFLPRIYLFLINLLTFNCLFTALMAFS